MACVLLVAIISKSNMLLLIIIANLDAFAREDLLKLKEKPFKDPLPFSKVKVL
jgi:hypothetical protein